MSNKIMMAILSVMTIFFLTAQTCSFGTTSTGLAAGCIGEGDIICDDTEAYECGLAAYGTGYYVSRASENDAECRKFRGSGTTNIDDTTLYADADKDGVYDADDICSGYDDTVDTDGDGMPDGCDFTCINTGDSGSDYYTAGSVMYNDGTGEVTYTESCQASQGMVGSLTEYSCSNNDELIEEKTVVCTYGCADDYSCAVDPTTDTDGNGLTDYIEETILYFKDFTSTTPLSNYELLNFDADSPDYTGYDTDADGYDGYINYFGSDSEKKGIVTGSVTVITQGTNSFVDMTSSDDDYVAFPGSNSAAPDVKWDLSRWIIIKARVRVPSSSTDEMQPIVIHETSTCYKPQYVLDLYEGNYRMVLNIGGSMRSVGGGDIPDTVTPGEWQEVVGVYTSTKQYLFVDGLLVEEKSVTGNFVPSIQKLMLGHSDPDVLNCAVYYDYEGYIDTVQIWGQ